MVKYPLKPVKMILKNHYRGEVSEEAVILVRDILLNLTDFLAEHAVKDFDKVNQKRQEQGLTQLKRLDKDSFKNVWERIYKQIVDKNIGEVGTSNESLLCQDGAKNA